MSTGFSTPLVHSPRSPQGPYAYRSGIGIIPSAEWNVFHDNFNKVIATNVPSGWTAPAVIDTGATVVADTTVTHPSGGLLFDSDGTTEGAAIYLPKTAVLIAGKKTLIEMKFKTEAAADTDVQFGLTDLTATTNPEDLWTTTAASVLSFGVLDGDATVGVLADKANVGTAVSAGTIDLVDSTWHILAILYDGSVVKCYVDGQLAVTTSTTIPTATLLAPFIGFRNGSTANNEGYCSWFRIIQEQ